MTALELADRLDAYAPADKGYMLNEAAAMLRKQAEAVKTLREALQYIHDEAVGDCDGWCKASAASALEATKELK